MWRRVGLFLCVLSAVAPSTAAAQPGSGPREDVDQSFTTTLPGTPTGLNFSATYHAAGDPEAPPPYMSKMTFFPPRGMRYDTRVPERCTATDLELQVRGPDACPEGSRLGTGSTEGLFMAPITHAFVFSQFKFDMTLLNNTSEQILVVNSDFGFTVMRGRISPGGAITFKPTTCFPSPPAGECPDDYILQLGSSSTIPVYTKKRGRRTRAYAKTPARCPARGNWRSRIKFWWKDGSKDTVVTTQPCEHP